MTSADRPGRARTAAVPSSATRLRCRREEIDAFIAEKHTLSIATLNRDGSIHMVAMWYGFLEGEIAFTSKAKAQKVLNLRRNPNITVMAEEGEAYNELVGVSDPGHRGDRRGSRAHVRGRRSACSSATPRPTTRSATASTSSRCSTSAS